MTEQSKVLELIDEKIKEHGKDLDTKEQDALRETFKDIFVNGKKPYEAMKLPTELLKQFYSVAYNQYNSGKYKEALPIFDSLLILDPMNPDYYFGKAACHQQLKEYEDAAQNFFSARLFNPTFPQSYLHIAYCMEQLGEEDSRKMALAKAYKLCGEYPHYSKVKEKCRAQLEKAGVNPEELSGTQKIDENSAFGKLQNNAKKNMGG